MVWFPWISLLYPKGHSWWQLKLSRTGQSTLPTHNLGIKSVSPGLGRHVPLTADNGGGVPGEGSQQSPRKVDGVRIQYCGIERLISDHPSGGGKPLQYCLYTITVGGHYTTTQGGKRRSNESNVLW